MQPDEKPWVEIAKKVVAGQFDRADASTIESLWIGVHDINDETCRRAKHHISHIIRKKVEK